MQHITLYEKDVFCRHGYSDKAIYSHIIEYEEVLPHNHEFIEFFYVFEGTCNHLLNGELQVLHVGDALVLPPSDIHQYIPSNTTFLHRDFVFKLDFPRPLPKNYRWGNESAHQAFRRANVKNRSLRSLFKP